MASSRLRLLRGTPRGSEVTLGDAPPPRDASVLDAGAPAAPALAGTLEEANERVLEIVEEAIRESASIRQRAYREGYEAGQREGESAARSDLAGALGLVTSVANDARQLRNALLRNSEEELVDLAIEVARAVVGEALAVDRRAVVATVERALERAATMNIVRIRVHPDDVTQVVAHFAEGGAAGSSGWEVTGDATVGIAGCVVDVVGGEIDARLDVQFDLVADALRELAATPADLAAGEEAQRAA